MTRQGRATFTRESAERIARAVRQVELGTPSPRPLSFEAVLSQANRRATGDVRVAERAMVVVPPSITPVLDYSAWPTGAAKTLVISGEFWPAPASAFAGSGSDGSATYTKTANYPAVQNEQCSFTITVTDNRVPDPEANPPQEAVQYSVPASLPLGIGQNNEGILSIATVTGSAAWNVEAGTLIVSLMPGESTTETVTGTCLQNGLGKHILAENVGAKVEQFEVEPEPQYMVVRRDKDASPRWMAVSLDPKHSAYGFFYGEWGQNALKGVIIRVRNVGLERQFHNVLARNPGGKIGTQLPGSLSNKTLDELYGSAPSTFVVVGRTSSEWMVLAPVSRPNVLRFNGTFTAPWPLGAVKTVQTTGQDNPGSVAVSNGLGNIRGVGSRACVITGIENQNGGIDWSLAQADLGLSGIVQGTFAAPWLKGQSAQVTVDFGNGPEEISASNNFSTVVGTGTRGCVVCNIHQGPPENWVLIAAECDET